MSGPERQAISDLLSLLGLSLDGLIIEEVPKLPLSLSKPIDQQLILSIRAPVAKEDLVEIKRPKSSLFFLEEERETVNKNPWNLEVESLKGSRTRHYFCVILGTLSSYAFTLYSHFHSCWAINKVHKRVQL